jgi:hypothetical protein
MKLIKPARAGHRLLAFWRIVSNVRAGRKAHELPRFFSVLEIKRGYSHFFSSFFRPKAYSLKVDT